MEVIDKFNAAQYQRERRLYLKSLGICIRCGYQDAIPNMVLCTDCREKNNASRRGKPYKQLTDDEKKLKSKKHMEKYYMRKENGLCVHCGKPALTGMTKCRDCRTYYNQYRSGYFEHTAKYIRKEIELGRL